MLTRQQHRFGLGELAKELRKISQDVKKNKKLLDIKLQVWKDYFWDDIFFIIFLIIIIYQILIMINVIKTTT